MTIQDSCIEAYIISMSPPFWLQGRQDDLVERHIARIGRYRLVERFAQLRCRAIAAQHFHPQIQAVGRSRVELQNLADIKGKGRRRAATRYSKTLEVGISCSR
jgi:hypothetical protein